MCAVPNTDAAFPTGWLPKPLGGGGTGRTVALQSLL